MKKLLSYEPIENLLRELNNFLPKFLGAILLFIIAWILLKLILYVVKKSLKFTRIDGFFENLFKENSIFKSENPIRPTKVIVSFIKWFLILVFIIIGSDLLGLSLVSREISRVIEYLPQAFSAFVIFGFGVYLATLLKKSTKTILGSLDLSGTNIISRIVFYLVFITITIIALNQAGVNTDIITNNLTLILGALLVTLALSLGLGSRDVVQRLLLGYYARRNFSVGQKIKIDDFEGTILTIDNICMVVGNEHDRRVYPIKKVSNKVIQIE